MHIPHGVLIGLTVLVNEHLAWAFIVPFLAYEALEEWRIADHSYRDLLGALIGIAGVTVGFLARRWVRGRRGEAA